MVSARRARDGRGAHDQHVRLHALSGAGRARCSTPKRCCSSTTATASSRKCHASLDQRVRADGDVDVARGQRGQRLGPLAPRMRAGQQDHSHRPIGAGMGQALEHPAEGACMLLGQDLGGGHDGALRAVGDRHPQRGRGHRGLARADVALQQPAHRSRLRQVAAICARARRCAAVMSNGRAAANGASVASSHADGPGGCSSEAPARRQDAQLQDEELVEAQPPVRGRQAFMLSGKWICVSASASGSSPACAAPPPAGSRTPRPPTP